VNRPRSEAEEIMARLTGYKRHEIYLKDDPVLTEDFQRRFENMIENRREGIPLQYITGVQNFFGLDFKVDERVLIPRQDTETLVEVVLAFAKRKPHGIKILDVCTGSGNIAISLACHIPHSQITAIDISKDALDVAIENARLNNAERNIVFLQGDIFAPLKKGDVFDVIVSNPPYIPSKDIDGLEPQVKDYEPRVALDGSCDGLRFYRRLVTDAVEFLAPGALLAVETGFDQAKDVIAMLYENGNYTKIESAKDIAGIDRVVSALRIG